MKKILVILACVAMLFSFASCDNGSGSAVTTSSAYRAADVLKPVFGDDAMKSNGLLAAIGTAASEEDAQISATSATVVVEAADLTGISDALGSNRLVSSNISFTINKDAATDTDQKTAITSASVNGSITYVDVFYDEHTVTINGAVDMAGTFAYTAATDQTPASAAISITSLSLPETVSISADGSGADTKTVFEIAGITSTEAAEAAAQKAAEAKVKEFVAAIQTGLGSSSTYAINSEKTGITVTAANVIDTDKAAVMTLTGTVGGTTGAYTLNVTKATIGKIEDVTDYGTLDFSQATVTVTVAQGESIGLTTDDGTIAGATAAAKPTSGLTVTVTGTVKLGDYSVQIAATSAN